MCSVTDFIIFFFIYKINGTPLGERPQSKEAEPTQFIPAQWGKDSKLAFTWPKGEVPYFFDTKSYDASLKSRVLKAIGALEADSCIRFKEQKSKPSTSSGSWLHFTNPGAKRDCFHEPSYRANGEIQVVLGYDCLKQRDITHAVMHGIGFRDEVAHPQRDLYVKIMWANIQPVYRALFRIQPMEHAAGLLEYDPMSIMHFHDRAFSLNGQATVTALLPGLKIDSSNELSHLDKMKLRIMFGHECNKRKVGEVLESCQSILSEDGPQDEITHHKHSHEKDISSKHEVDETNKEDEKPETLDLKEEVIIVDDKIDENAAKDNDDYEKPNERDDSNKQDVDDRNKDDKKPEDVDNKEEVIIVGDKIYENTAKDNDDYQNQNDYDDPNKQDVDVSNKDDKKPENVDNKEEVIIVGDKIYENAVKGNDDYQNQNDYDDPNKQNADKSNKDDKKSENVDPKEEFIIVGDKIDENAAKDNDDYQNQNNYDDPNKQNADKSNKDDKKSKKVDPKEEFIIVGDKIDENAAKNNDNYQNQNDYDDPNKQNVDVSNKDDKKPENDDNKEEVIIVGDKIYENAVKDNDDFQNQNDYDDPNKQHADKSNKDDKKSENVDPKEEFIIVGDKIDENAAKDNVANEEFVIVGDKITDDISEEAGKYIKNEDGNENKKSGDKIFVVGDKTNKEGKGLENNNPKEEFIVVGDNVKGGGDNANSNENDQEDVDEDNTAVEDKASNVRKVDNKQKAQQEILGNEGADENDNSLKGNVVHNENLENTD